MGRSLKQGVSLAASPQSPLPGQVSTPSSFCKRTSSYRVILLVKVKVSQTVVEVVTRQDAQPASLAVMINSSKSSMSSILSKWPARVGLRTRVGWIRVRLFEVRWEAGRRTDPSSTHLLPLSRRTSWNGLGGGSLRWLTLVGRGRRRRRRWKGEDGPMRGEEKTLERREFSINPSLSRFSLPSQAKH